MQKKLFQWTPLCVLFFFFLPYIGELGRAVFEPLGKYYYVILALIAFSEAFVRRLVLHRDGLFRWMLRGFFIPCGVVAAAMAASWFFCENTVDNCAFAVVIAFFCCYFCALPETQAFLRRLGAGAMLCLGVMALVTLLEGKASHFNPNSYGFISCAMFLFGSLYFFAGEKPVYRQPLFWGSLVAAVCLISPVYGCETQLVCLGFFLVWLCLLPLISGRKWRFVCATGAVFAVVLFLPLVTYVLIDWGVLPTSFITDRGERWNETMAALQEVGLFRVARQMVRPHNGFLDMAVKYGVIPGLGVYVGLFFMVLRCYSAVRSSKTNGAIYSILMTFLLMNSVESFFVGLTDCYYLLLALALLFVRAQREGASCG